jgi:hypothetical protein
MPLVLCKGRTTHLDMDAPLINALIYQAAVVRCTEQPVQSGPRKNKPVGDLRDPRKAPPLRRNDLSLGTALGHLREYEHPGLRSILAFPSVFWNCRKCDIAIITQLTVVGPAPASLYIGPAVTRGHPHSLSQAHLHGRSSTFKH